MSNTIKQKLETKIWELEEAETNSQEEIYLMDCLKIILLAKSYTRENLEHKAANLKAIKFRNEKQNCLLDALNDLLTS